MISIIIFVSLTRTMKLIRKMEHHVDKLLVCPNGAQHRDYNFEEKPSKPDWTLYLGRIEPRKRQYVYQAYIYGY